MKILFRLLFLLPLVALADTNWQEPSNAQAVAGTLGAPFAMTPRRVAAYVAAHGGGGGAITSVFGRTGVVVAVATDYSGFYGQLTAANAWTGVNTFSGSFIFPPASITITANSGPFDITKSFSVATNGANTTLVMSAAGTTGQQVYLNAVNSDTAAHTWTIDNPSGTDPTFTVAASTTTPIKLQSNGTVWSIIGGAPTINDITTVTVASGDFLGFWDISGGVSGKATVANIVSTALTATPATVAQGGTGLATLTSGGLLVGAGTGNVTFITPGTGVATALGIAANATGGFVTAGGAPRILTITSSGTPTINTDSYDCVTITAQAAAITSMTTNRTGTINNFQQLEIRIKDDGTARAITWGADFSSGLATLPVTTTLGKTLVVYLTGDTVTGDFMCMATGSYP